MMVDVTDFSKKLCVASLALLTLGLGSTALAQDLADPFAGNGTGISGFPTGPATSPEQGPSVQGMSMEPALAAYRSAQRDLSNKKQQWTAAFKRLDNTSGVRKGPSPSTNGTTRAPAPTAQPAPTTTESNGITGFGNSSQDSQGSGFSPLE